MTANPPSIAHTRKGGAGTRTPPSFFRHLGGAAQSSEKAATDATIAPGAGRPNATIEGRHTNGTSATLQRTMSANPGKVRVETARTRVAKKCPGTIQSHGQVHTVRVKGSSTRAALASVAASHGRRLNHGA